MDDANKQAIADAFSNARKFASGYRSRERHLEMLTKGNLLSLQAAKVSAVQTRANAILAELNEEKRKLQEMQDSIPATEKWLIDNKEKFDSLEVMLSDKMTELAQKLSKLANPS